MTLPSFIVTLGMMEIARGAAYRVTGSETQYIGARIERVADLSVLGLSMPFILAIVVVVVAQLILSYTAFGRHTLAVGANEESARLSGIPTRRIKFVVYVLSGALCAAASVVHCSRLSSADPNAGIGFELQAIAAVVIGGTSLMGGRGNVVNSFIGVLIIAVLQNGLAQLGALEPTKRLVTGCVIVAAVVMDYYRNRTRPAGSG
jgi:ribose transport system permease protein